MDDNEDERYLPNNYKGKNQQGYGSSDRQKLPLSIVPCARSVGDQYIDVDEDGNSEAEDDDMELLGEEDRGSAHGNNGVHYIGKDADEDDDDDGDDKEDFIDDNDGEDGQEANGRNYSRTDEDDLEMHPKKRKLKSLISRYEFAPRLPAAPLPALPAPKLTSVGRNPLTDWTEHETVVLLDAWGDKFLEHGRKSLRSDEWMEVAEKVSKVSKIERSDTQCRNRLDTLKKKYKKEKLKAPETGGNTSNWVYFKKMDALMSTSTPQPGLSCGLGPGEFVFTNPNVYLNRANGLDEMRDSPGNSEPDEAKEDDSDGLPPKKRRSGRDGSEGSSFRLLADSIYKFSEIYEKIEDRKCQQMLELEKMRMDFLRDLEAQRKKIMEKIQTEIAKICHGNDEVRDLSTGRTSG